MPAAEAVPGPPGAYSLMTVTGEVTSCKYSLVRKVIEVASVSKYSLVRRVIEVGMARANSGQEGV